MLDQKTMWMDSIEGDLNRMGLVNWRRTTLERMAGVPKVGQDPQGE